MFQKFKDYFMLLRPINVGMIIAMTVTGIWFGDPNQGLTQIFLNYTSAIIVAVTYTGIAMVHNDVLDMEIDLINQPQRALPSGRVSKKGAYIYMGSLFIVGTFFGNVLSVPSRIIMFSTLILSLLYNWKLKKGGFIGNLVVGFTATSAFIYGDAVAAGWTHFWPWSEWNASIYLFLISSLLNTGREVCKGIMDVEGDSQFHVQTIAVIYGKKAAARLVLSLILLAVVFSIVPVVTNVFGPVFILGVLSTLGLMLINGIPLLKNPNYETAKKFKDLLHPIMLFALLLVVIDIIFKRFLYLY